MRKQIKKEPKMKRIPDNVKFTTDEKSIAQATHVVKTPLYLHMNFVVLSDMSYPVACFLLPEDAQKYIEANPGMGFRLVDTSHVF